MTTRQKCDCHYDICIRATSGQSGEGSGPGCYTNDWPGHEIELLKNNEIIGSFPPGFEDHPICIWRHEVDIQNDVFELRRTGNDGVCITGLYFNDFSILVGRHNKQEKKQYRK